MSDDSKPAASSLAASSADTHTSSGALSKDLKFAAVKRRRESKMARKTVLVSDLTGKEIRDEKDSAQVVIKYGDARRGQVTLDVLASEVDDLAGKGRKTARRGRKPKDAAA